MRGWCRILSIGAAILSMGAVPWFATPQTPRNANYVIQARFYPDRRTVEGQVLLTWRNLTFRTPSRLCFHMYMNAFKNANTLFMRERKGRIPDEPDAWGWIEMRSIQTADGRALSFRYAEDGTVLWVKLNRAVAPGETIQLQYEFETKLPRIIARTGYAGDFYMVAQWFPKIGVLEARGWNCHPFHATSEFYADFGVYDVQIDVPRTFVVGATGERVTVWTRRDRRVYRYQAEDVHDFVWTAYPRFREVTTQWQHVQLRLLYPPGHQGAVDRILSAVQAALRYTAEWYGVYPYPVLTIVDPPLHGLRAGGMEYPTLFTTALGIRLPQWFPILETVTVHEFGHQYWYGMVASNEFEAAWLDEGITSYMEARIMNRLFGPRFIRLPLIGLWGWHYEAGLGSSVRYFSLDPANQFAWHFVTPGSYAANSYTKVALVMLSLERLFGEENVTRALAAYFKRWRFRHPYPEDFFRTMGEALGPRAERFLRETLDNPVRVDFRVSEVSCTQARRPQGFFGFGKKRRWQTFEPIQGRWRCRVLLQRETFGWPVEVTLRLENGDVRSWVWDASRPWARWERDDLPAPIVEVWVDPRHRILLDENRSNNGWVRRSPSALGGFKRRLWGWFSHLFAIIMTLG